MGLSRCPSCKNMIAQDTPECPICGRNWRSVWVWRITRWCILLGLLAYFGVRVFHH